MNEEDIRTLKAVCTGGNPRLFCHCVRAGRRRAECAKIWDVAGVTADDPIVAAVREDLLARSLVGLKKYGVGLDRTDLSKREWLRHAYEEALDLACYLKRAMGDVDAQSR